MPEGRDGGTGSLRRGTEPLLDSRVHRVTIRSHALGILKSFYIYTPPDYDPDGARLPTLYLFRGHEREWVNPVEDTSRGGRTVIDVYLDLLDVGAVGRMLLVFPGISSDDNRVPGMLTNFLHPDLVPPGTTGIGTGRFESYFIHDLIPYVEHHYRAINRRDGRGVDGFSLGGFMALKIAAQYPDKFCTAGAYDGSFFYAAPDGRTIRSGDMLFHNPMLDPVFGRPRIGSYAAQNNPANLLLTGKHKHLSTVQWLVQAGPESGEPSHANYYRGRHIADILTARAIPNGLPLVYPDGDHNWATADRHLRDSLPLHWRAFSTKN